MHFDLHSCCPLWAETMCFPYPGQYWDVETGLNYNRFRYYDAGEGFYISRDPMSFAAAFGGGLVGGGNPTEYGYVTDPLYQFDTLGLSCEVDDIAKKYGGRKTDDLRYIFEGAGAKRRAIQSASEILGNLGSKPRRVRRREYTDSKNTYRDNNSNRVIGKHSTTKNDNNQPIAGYHDHEIGHSRFDAPRHLNAWNESNGTTYTNNANLYY